jgi:colanic acid biosynthesis glycosyl transferase WcaI
VSRRRLRARPDVSILGLNFPPESTGIAPYTGALAAGLQELGYRVSAHVAHPHYPEWAIYEGYGQWRRTEQFGGVAVYRRLHYVPRSPHGTRRKVPLIIWVQDIYTLGMAETGEGGGLAGGIIRWVEGRTLRAADRVVVIHQRFADYAVAEFGVEASKVTVVRNWAHLPPADPVDALAARSALGWPTDVTLAVHTGNMGVKQGLENIVEAARIADKRGSPVHFVLVGEGGERRRLMERARGISSLTFVDPLNDDDYHLALSAADVLLVNEMPGVSAMAVPSKLTSYFDAGRPVVAATDRNGITASEVMASGAGTVVPAGQPRLLLDEVLDMSQNSEAMAQFGLNGRRYREAVLDQRAAMRDWANVVSALVTGAPSELTGLRLMFRT